MIYKSPERKWWHRWWVILEGHLWYGPFLTRFGARRFKEWHGHEEQPR